ncbi:hypothetical protein TrLO_g13540 [Triparma laevis f. longispina]|uniref:Uncharacterized protein n=1 Tax=Triparma laevis f. longispina TaxID=1714387 RepID=A0A9W7F4P3_9STRA|nr:hypothetical protein TrLO_g13540 [Triparma laevis f. longispina]
MRRRSFDRGSDADTKRRLLLSSSYSQLPSANSSGNDVPSNQFGARQGAALKKKKPNFPQHPKRPLPQSSAIDYFNEAFQQTFPPPIVIDDSDINAASLLRDPPVVRESTTSPSRTRPPYISPPPLSLQIETRSTRSTRSTPNSQSNSESTPASEIFPFHSSTPFSRRRPSSGVNPENTLRNPEKISEELIEHDAKYLKNYKRKVKANWGCVKIQCWWRCVRHRSKMTAWKQRRSDFKGRHFRSWSVLTRADRKFKSMVQNHAFRMWRDLWQDIKYTKYASKVIFEKSINSGRLTVPSVNLFFQDDLDLLDNEEGFERIKMERTLAGIRRQILTILYKEWVSRSRFAKKRRLAACEKLQSALRKCPSYGTWAGELANTGFHMWHRWANYRVKVKAGGERPKYKLELLEWNNWVVKWETRRELKANCHKMGKQTFIKNKFRRWRHYARYLAAQSQRMESAIQHHRRAKINLILTRWCQFCKGRGKAHRRRLVYLLAWKEWAPRESRMRDLSKKTIEKVKEVRMRCIMRNWNQRVQHSLTIYAYGNSRLQKCEQPQRLSALKAAYCFLNRTAPFISVICFTKWKRYTNRVKHWRAFKFWNYHATCDHVKRMVFKSWYYVTAKNWKPIAEKLTLEPANMIHRGKGMLKRIKMGYDVSVGISDAECERLLCGDVALLPAPPIIGTTDKNGKLITSPVKVTPKKLEKINLANIVISAVNSEQVSASSSPNTAKREKQRLLQKSMQMQLIDAINICDVPKIKSLLAEGVNANAVSTDGSLRTALHLASEHMSLNFFPIVVLLLRCGASTHAFDSHGKKPIDLTINPHVAALLHQHMGRCEKRQWSSRERKRCMMLLTERSKIGTREFMQYACAEFLATKKHELEMRLVTLPIDTPKILSASQLTNQTGDQSHLDNAMEELASTSDAEMDQIVEAVMILQTTVRYHSIGHHVEKAQRALDGLIDSPDPTEIHFETVASDYKDVMERAETKLDGDGDSEDENDIGLPAGVELIGDVRFVGKKGKDNNVQRRKRCAELYCINGPQGADGAVAKERKKKGGERKVVHKFLAQLIENAEAVIEAKVEEQGVMVERDNVLLQKAFEREIRMHKKKEVVDPSKIFVTGDLMHLLEERDRVNLVGGNNNHNTATAPAKAEEDFTLTLKSDKKQTEEVSGDLQAIISISPNTLPRRQIGQDLEVDMFLANLVKAVPFRNIVEGFASKGIDGSGLGGSNLLPNGWWDRSRTYMALLEEAISLDFRLTASSVRTKELKKKSANLTEAIDVVRKSAFETGSELRELAKDRVVVDTDNGQILRSSKGAVKKWERFLRDNGAASEQAQADVKRMRRKFSSKILEEEEAAKKRADEERLRAAKAKGSPKKKDKKGKGGNKKAEKSPPPPKKKKRKEGEEEDAKTEEEMTADELGDMLKAYQGKVEELKKKAEVGANKLGLFQDKVKHAEDNIRGNAGVMVSTVKDDFSVMNQLHTAISDYKREQAKVDAEVKMKIKEGKEIATQIEDVAYTARLIAPGDAPPFEYKLSRGPSPNKVKGAGKKKGKKGAVGKEEPVAFLSWKPNEEKEEEKKEGGLKEPEVFSAEAKASSGFVAKPEPVGSGSSLVKRVEGAAAGIIPAGVASPGVTLGKSTAAPPAPAPLGIGKGLSAQEKEQMRAFALSPPVELEAEKVVVEKVVEKVEVEVEQGQQVQVEEDNYPTTPLATTPGQQQGFDGGDNESLDQGGSVAPFSPFHDDNDSIERMHPGDLVGEEQEDPMELQGVPPRVETPKKEIEEDKVVAGEAVVETTKEKKKVEEQQEPKNNRKAFIHQRQNSTLSVDSVNFASEESSSEEEQDLVGFETIEETVEPLDVGQAESRQSSRASSPVSSIPSPSQSNSPPASPIDSIPPSLPNMFEGLMGTANQSKSPTSPLSPGVDNFIAEMSPSKNAMTADDELQEMYDKALGLLFRRERVRHRKVLNEEARRKFEDEENAKEDAAKTAKWKEDKQEKEHARSTSPDGRKTPENTAIRPTLLRKRSSIRKDFDRISSTKSNRRKHRKGPGSDEQFYQAVDCHTMRKFIRKRKEKIEKVKEEAAKSTFGGTFELDEIDDLVEAEAESEGEKEDEDKILSEDYEYANINRIIRTRRKIAEEDITESLYEDDADAETWKASKSTPYINSSVLAEIPDDDLRRMTANIGVSVSMLDEKESTKKVLETLGEARKKRVNMESLRLKSNDQFMLVGSAEAELIAKAGGVYDPVPKREDLLAQLGLKEDKCGGKYGEVEGEVEGEGEDSESSGILQFSDEEGGEGGKKLEFDEGDDREEGGGSGEEGRISPNTIGTDKSPGKSPGSKGRSAKVGRLFDGEKKSFYRGKSHLEESSEEENSDDDFFAPRKSKLLASKTKSMQRSEEGEEGEGGKGDEGDDGSLESFGNGKDSAPFFSTSHLTDDQKSEAQGFTVEGLKKIQSDVDIEQVLIKKAQADAKLNEMKHYRVPTPQDGLGNHAKKGGKKPTGLFVRGTSNLSKPDIPSNEDINLAQGSNLDGMSLDTSVLELGGGEVLTVSVRGLDSAENSLSGDQWTVPDDSIFDHLDDEDDDDGESVEDIVSGILEKLSTLRGGSQVFDDETDSMVDQKKLRRSMGKMHVGTSGLKHKYAGQASVGDETTPFVDEKPFNQSKMKISGASKHFGEKQDWPESGYVRENDRESDRGSTGGWRQLPTASSLTASSMGNGGQDRRMNTASTWNTISSRPGSTSSGYGGSYGDSRPSTGQFANIKLTDSANVRIVRSQDGMEYIYKVYDERGGDLDRGQVINTPAALPTQMLFDESGQVYGEVLKFTEDGEIDGPMLKKEDPNRAQTAGEYMKRSPDKLNISGVRIVRNGNVNGMRNVVSRGDVEGRRGGGELDINVDNVMDGRPVTSPMKLPSWGNKMNVSVEDRARIWNNFEMGKMSDATSKAYQALLDDDDGMLFGEEIEEFGGDILPGDVRLVNFEEALGMDHPLRADIERLRREGPDFLFEGTGGTGGKEDEEVTEALRLAKEAGEDQERQEREGEEGENYEFEFENQSGYRFFDDAELEELDASVGGRVSPGSFSVSVKVKGGGEVKAEVKNVSPLQPLGVGGVVEEGSSLMSGGGMSGLGQGSVGSVTTGGKSQWTEVAVQDALRRLNAELATNEMSLSLTRFKDSVTRRRIEEAMVEASTLAREQLAKSGRGGVVGGSEEEKGLVLTGKVKARTAERKKRKPLMKITQFEPHLLEGGDDAESLKVSLGEGVEVEEEVEEEEVVEEKEEEEVEVEAKVEKSRVDVSGMMNVNLGARGEGDGEGEEGGEGDSVFDNMSQKRRAWNRTASAPAALGEEKVAEYKMLRQETSNSIETSLGSLEEQFVSAVDGVFGGTGGAGGDDVSVTPSFVSHDSVLDEEKKEVEEKVGEEEKVEEKTAAETTVETTVVPSEEVAEEKKEVEVEEVVGKVEEEPSNVSNVKFEDESISAAPSTPNNKEGTRSLEEHEHRPITPMLSPKPPPNYKNMPKTPDITDSLMDETPQLLDWTRPEPHPNYENMPKTPEIVDRLMDVADLANREDDDEQSLASHIWKLDGDDPEFNIEGDVDVDVGLGDGIGMEEPSDFVVMAADMSLISGTTTVEHGFDPPAAELQQQEKVAEEKDEGEKKEGGEKKGTTSVEGSRQSSRQGSRSGSRANSRPGSSTSKRISPRLGEQPSVLSSAVSESSGVSSGVSSVVSSKRSDSRGGKKKKKKGGKEKTEKSIVEDKSVEEVVTRTPLKTPAFRRETVKKVSPTKNNDWQNFSRKKELEEIDRAEKRAFYLKMKRDSSKMGSKAASALLGAGDDLDEISLDSDDEYQAIENLDLAKFAADPLDRRKEKRSRFKSLHSEGMETSYVGRRRGPSMREKVRGKSYLLKEGFPEEMRGLKRSAIGVEEEGEEEEVDVDVGLENLLMKAERGGGRREEEKKEVDLVSPEKVVLPKIK